ncbi:phage tail tape measure protein [Nesterenkonia haasae]|uniref:phage tail tape measure protein n=1 Tax=Nesterenkonia haasae TaxID=2587813 RepID=UPI00139129F3|nr:phage tail tape measure protein [Nesterenkonia haasae]NDK31177.1 phage tail tape measure protein [Nesterenkonia haasae]
MADRRVKLILEAQVDQFNNNLRRAQTEAEGLGNKLQRSLGSREMQSLGRHLAAFGAATVAALGMAAKAAIDWETAWTDVMRRTDGTPQQLGELEDALRGVARELPTTHQEVAAVAAAAAQLGVSVDDVEDFTRVMIDMGVATNMTAEDAATAMARFANVMGTPIPDMDRLGSAIVDLGNNSATTESEIMDMAQNIAGAGAAFGMSEGEVLGFAAALTSVGVPAAMGGTAVSRMMYDIDAATTEGGEALQGFADIAGMTADEFANLWQEDSASALESFVLGLQRASEEGTSVAESLGELGINEQRTVRAFTNMAAAGDFLGDSLDRGNTAWEENSALATEAGYVYDTTAARIQAAWAQIQDAAIDAGQYLLPVIDFLLDGVSRLATGFQDLPGPAQGALTYIGALVGPAALLAGSFILLAPRIFETRDALRAMNIIGPGANSVLRNLGRAAGIAGAAAGVIFLADSLLRLGDTQYDVSRMALEVENDFLRMAEAGTNASVGFSHLEANKDSWWQNGLSNEINNVADAWMHMQDTADKWHSGGPEMFGFNNLAVDLNEFTAAFEAADTAMANMAANGRVEAVADQMHEYADAFAAAGLSSRDLGEAFPELRDQLIQLQNEVGPTTAEGRELAEVIELLGGRSVISAEGTDKAKQSTSELGEAALDAAGGIDELDGGMDELTAGLEEVGLAADGTVESLSAFMDVLFEAGILTMDSREATSRFHEAIRNADDALKTITESQGEMGRMLNRNKTDFDLTTEAGQLANGAFQDITKSGFDAAQAMAENGASQDDVQGKLRRTYDSLIETAIGFGISEDAAIELTREVMGIPGDVSIDSWMSEEAKRVAEETKRVLDATDGTHIRTSHTHTVNRNIRESMQRLGIDPRHNNVAMATGGAVRGPGTGTSDDIPAWLSNGEHVLTAKEVGLMGGQQGVYDFRRSLTGTTPQRPSGRDLVPTYATGGAATRGSGGGGIDYERLANAVSNRPFVGTLQTAEGAFLGEVQMAMRHPAVIRTASQGLAEQSGRDQRGTGGRRR